MGRKKTTDPLCKSLYRDHDIGRLAYEIEDKSVTLPFDRWFNLDDLQRTVFPLALWACNRSLTTFFTLKFQILPFTEGKRGEKSDIACSNLKLYHNMAALTYDPEDGSVTVPLTQWVDSEEKTQSYLPTPIMDKDAWIRRQHLSWDNPSGDN